MREYVNLAKGRQKIRKKIERVNVATTMDQTPAPVSRWRLWAYVQVSSTGSQQYSVFKLFHITKYQENWATKSLAQKLFPENNTNKPLLSAHSFRHTWSTPSCPPWTSLPSPSWWSPPVQGKTYLDECTSSGTIEIKKCIDDPSGSYGTCYPAAKIRGDKNVWWTARRDRRSKSFLGWFFFVIVVPVLVRSNSNNKKNKNKKRTHLSNVKAKPDIILEGNE